MIVYFDVIDGKKCYLISLDILDEEFDSISKIKKRVRKICDRYAIKKSAKIQFAKGFN